VTVILADLAPKAGIAVPRTKVTRNQAPNARVSLAAGASPVISRGLLDYLSPLALIGTMGHEIGHIISGHLTGRKRILPLSWLALLVGTCLLCVLWKAGAVAITWPVYAAVATGRRMGDRGGAQSPPRIRGGPGRRPSDRGRRPVGRPG
jgi:Zn-dependent protease with chaperone function